MGTSTTRYWLTRPTRSERIRAATIDSRAVTVETVFRREYGRCVATLIRFLGDIEAAEEAVQDAFTVAVARWPSDGEPPNPGAWIVTTARNRAVDRLRGTRKRITCTLPPLRPPGTMPWRGRRRPCPMTGCV